MALGMVGIEGIADILEVSESRVRQLILQDGGDDSHSHFALDGNVASAANLR